MRLSLSALAANVFLVASALGDGAYAAQGGKVRGYYPSFNSDGQPPAAIDWGNFPRSILIIARSVCLNFAQPFVIFPFAAGFTDVLYFMVEPQANFTLTYDPKFTYQQGEQLVTEFIAEARKRAFCHVAPILLTDLRSRLIEILSAQLDHVNPIISVGGWTGSGAFSVLTRSDASRNRFARVLVEYAQKHGFVGIEMDWECWALDATLSTRMTLFTLANSLRLDTICQARGELRTLWPEASLTIAVGLGGLTGASGSPATAAETALLVQNLNNVHLMAYDVYGGWAPTTGPLAPLHATCAPPAYAQSVDTGVQAILKQGFNPSQIILGIPGYAKRFELTSPHLVPKTVGSQTTFYYQNHTKATPPGGKFDDKPHKNVCGDMESWGGSFLVTELISNGWLSPDQKTGLNGYKHYLDACSGEPFLTNGKYLITYDDMGSSVTKAMYAKENRLGGIYFYDTMGPTPATIQAAGRAFRD
ncbi:uncharacterized protein VP01_1350g5 [Puccinia sorghi]|uniref:GH18 domain-containing protein n=1 Tax=Puccinia sorghi TaxID=27349 RepID=A0A0L6VM62_9BASI|nr:uncharacterized protein VP01_1350g5 [Puccinia sorghi]